MESCPFVDREKELNILEKAYRERPVTVIVYGRRRIGKTRLVREWLNRKESRGVYYLAQLTSHKHNLALMTTSIARQLGLKELEGLKPERLTSLLTVLSQLGTDIIVIDEITYWIRGDPIVLSELQEFVDLELPKTNLTLVLTGSLLGIMHNTILGGGSPLYGRAKHRIMLDALPYRYIKCLQPKLSPVNRVRLYSLVDGVPYYNCMFRTSNEIDEVLDMITEKDSPLRIEKDFILREEFR
jgi:AAA+ ATPase superfamily predicted ATPase